MIYLCSLKEKLLDYTPLQTKLYDWYTANRRPLPWRETKDPYRIWISEIILQQTRVAQGTEYYLRFIKTLPTVSDLANASEDTVLKLWQGLGYYSRARNLHFSAKTIMENGGVFPDNYNGLLKLKGVGEYTASAIAAFAYDLPHAVVDGNVFRVLSRLFDLADDISTLSSKKKFTAIANDFLDKKRASIHNNTIMEFGALQCIGKQPNCRICPLENDCLANKRGTIHDRPFSTKKVKVKHRYFHFFIINNNNKIILQKREQKDIWRGLYQFPMIEMANATERPTPEMLYDKTEVIAKKLVLLKEKMHLLTHQKLYLYFWMAEDIREIKSSYVEVKKESLENYALPKPLLDILV